MTKYYGKRWTKTRDMAGNRLLSCPDHTSLREATSLYVPENIWQEMQGKWQAVDESDHLLVCDLCASEERQLGSSARETK